MKRKRKKKTMKTMKRKRRSKRKKTRRRMKTMKMKRRTGRSRSLLINSPGQEAQSRAVEGPQPGDSVPKHPGHNQPNREETNSYPVTDASSPGETLPHSAVIRFHSRDSGSLIQR